MGANFALSLKVLLLRKDTKNLVVSFFLRTFAELKTISTFQERKTEKIEKLNN